MIKRHAPKGLLVVLALLVGPVQAQPESLADHQVVVQISEGDAFKQKIVLNNVSNLLKHYGPDLVDIEVVAYGPGLRLLFEDNANQGRIDNLMKQGVEFSACSNTMANMGKDLDDLIAGTEKVAGGVVYLMERQEEGWSYLRP
ncbi:hypothetical protein AN478_06320 [Thiohalorhabdus denitrificans]|nr:hypothetical protein AN478_06320 [Thiohalorhabdus denitrificans]